ncbi:MAG: penicillin-binding protein [Candidatus Moranbacteria bacterium CG_4_10_14_3_um_filter_44_15]|nr:MAG: penicillin-binding protein [Candidatus Moranbacteria bacterium CG06_land_8_20_14_3_00_43_56]PIV83871.1 MAG: penicillin-binding protein [Candidatus Moranbacteria bacterium CG17_big_fil_post_rev_8_21_14_2_50_44_12]PIW93585.1 MAG: penicillin-binding protein [Candidatus Moranbacteria bacterium CG_4_8_14_3_um_filter_43_15]PIX90707.1 MAG: penicillin-binding protein [Candidatus Moranbacteria bacterium CG_4_10_14_3_um_filter_44_15]PJA86089.1 MAG: penicillin-binding protein [Candidatus Moranbact
MKNLVDNTKEALKKGKKKRSWPRRILKFFIWCAVAGLLFAIGIFAYYAKDLPSPGKLNKRQVVESTKIYDRTGEYLLYEIHGEEKRTSIPLKDMSEIVRAATIAAEDQTFYQHYGVQFKAIARAAIYDLLGRKVSQGGSTITQQLIKNTVLTPERTFTRKVKEVILSVELEQRFSKDEILEMYLNEIPYGSNAYGIQAAAQTFFGKDAKDLKLAESALLASLPKAPTYYSPYGSHLDELKGRQEYVLDQMQKMGYITSNQAASAKEFDVLAEIKPFQESIQAPHFVMYVKEQLVNKYGEKQVEEGGMKVYTTLDWGKQQIAEETVKKGVAANTKYRATNAALTAIDPKTGQILAMVGSRDYFDKSIDGNVNVAVRDRQPGSSFKPYVYATAFKKGYTPNTVIFDVETNFGTKDQPYTPQNYSNKFSGPVKMREALARSLNIPAVKTLYLAGVDNSINTAQSMGITTLKNRGRYGLALVLGGGEVKLIDHVSAFGTFATNGIRHDKTAILKITDSRNNVLEEYKSSPGEKVLDQDICAQIDAILSDNSLRSPVFGSNSPLRFDSRPVAVKTGTTNEWRDAWTVGYTPNLVAGVWAGNNNNAPMAAGADGVYVAAPIWREFMDKALANMAIERFPEAKEIKTGKAVLDGTIQGEEKEVTVCKIGDGKYCLANDNCPSEKKKRKKKFFSAHSILYWVDKDNPRGDVPKQPQKDPLFTAWEKGVVKWAEGKEFDVQENMEECKSSDF